jgi:hypothetical protein
MKRVITRYRLLLALVVVSFTVFPFYYFSNPLSVEERAFVGRWSSPVKDTAIAKYPTGSIQVFEFDSDRKVRFGIVLPDGTFWWKTIESEWWVHNGVLVLDNSHLTGRKSFWRGPVQESYMRFQVGSVDDERIEMCGELGPVTLTRDAAAPPLSKDLATPADLGF